MRASVLVVVLATQFRAQLAERSVSHRRLSATKDVVRTVTLTHANHEFLDLQAHCRGFAGGGK